MYYLLYEGVFRVNIYILGVIYTDIMHYYLHLIKLVWIKVKNV